MHSTFPTQDSTNRKPGEREASSNDLVRKESYDLKKDETLIK